MALDMGKDKIRVNSISPAWIWSPEVSKIDPQGRLIIAEGAFFNYVDKMR